MPRTLQILFLKKIPPADHLIVKFSTWPQVSRIYFINRRCMVGVRFLFRFCDPTSLEKVAKLPPEGFLMQKKCAISWLRCPNPTLRGNQIQYYDALRD
eukprot:SAG31_NODE_21497_length_548_cov_0.750557_1_plen_97_part_01